MDSLQGVSPFWQGEAEALGFWPDRRSVAETGDFLLQGGRQQLLRVGGEVEKFAKGVDEALHENAAFQADEQSVGFERRLMQVLEGSLEWTDVFRVIAEKSGSFFVRCVYGEKEKN